MVSNIVTVNTCIIVLHECNTTHPIGPDSKKRKIEPPSLGSITPSQAGRNSTDAAKIKVKIRKQPLYHHHFATDLYQAYLKFKTETGAVVQIGGTHLQVDQSSLETASNQLGMLLKCNPVVFEGFGGLMSNSVLRDESSKTSLCARHLDRFLFPGHQNIGMCLHQLSTRYLIFVLFLSPKRRVGLQHPFYLAT